MEEIELSLVNSTLFCQFSREFPGITIFRWCSSIVDYVELYGEGREISEARERLAQVAADINSEVVSSGNLDQHASAGISCRCTTHNSTIRLAETMNLLWEAPAVYSEGKERLRLVSFSAADLEEFFREASRNGEVEIVRKRRIEPDSLRDVYSISLKDLFGDLSVKQAKYLREAVDMGMFSTPRRMKIEELARNHTLSKSTMQEHIEKARNKLVKAIEPYLSLYIHSDPSFAETDGEGPSGSGNQTI